MRDDSVSQSSPAAGNVGAGARYRPSLRIAAGGSGRTTPNTSGVARSRKTTMAKYRRWRGIMPHQEKAGRDLFPSLAGKGGRRPNGVWASAATRAELHERRSEL